MSVRAPCLSFARFSRIGNTSSAKRLYNLGCMSQKDIADVLSVSPGRVSQWLSTTIKQEKERQKQRVFDMWLACETLETIAEAVGVTIQTVSNWSENFSKNLAPKELEKFDFRDTDFTPPLYNVWTTAKKTNNVSHKTVDNWSSDFCNNLAPKELQKFSFQDADFAPPLYNVWTTAKKTNNVSHFGNSEQRWLENLLYLYTNPFDIVVDPFAGGGSTIDACKERGRRYYVSDRKPIVEREHEIRQHDLTDGMPLVPRWKDVKLVYLDPPYWKQAEGQYSNDAADLANMELALFNNTLSNIIANFGDKLSGYGKPKYIALIIQPTQWRAPDRRFTDHVGDMLRMVNLPVHMRYSVPYQSEQYNAQQVEWAKANKATLVLTREIVVWEVA